jgi:hypothetical protein
MIWTRGLTHLASSFAVWRLYTQFLGVGCDGKVDAYRYLAPSWSAFRLSRARAARKTEL